MELTTLRLVAGSSATLSLVGCIFIIFMYIFSPTTRHRILNMKYIFFLSWSDLGASLAYLLIEPCRLQGFLLQFFALSSAIWSTCFAHSLYGRVRELFVRWMNREKEREVAEERRRRRRERRDKRWQQAMKQPISSLQQASHEASLQEQQHSQTSPERTIEDHASTHHQVEDDFSDVGINSESDEDNDDNNNGKRKPRDQLLECFYMDYLYHLMGWVVPFVAALAPMAIDGYDLTGAW